MFGNVAEWVWTARGDEERFTPALGWPDPACNASLALGALPWSRLPSQGLRLASYPNGAPDASLLAPVEVSAVDHAALEPLSVETLALVSAPIYDARDSLQASEKPV